LGKPHPEQDRVGGEPGLRARRGWPARSPRVGRSIPRATGGPDEWLLPPLPGGGDRIRLTDLLRRAAPAPRPTASHTSHPGSATRGGVDAPCRGAMWGRVVEPRDVW